MDAWITAIGHALPGAPITQPALVDWLRPRLAPGTGEGRLERFAERSGVGQRHSVLDWFGPEGEALFPLGRPHGDATARSAAFVRHAPTLAAAAVRAAGIDPTSVTHVVVATCTGAVAPGIDLALLPLLGLRSSVRRTVVGFMGCYAALPALRVARDTVLADPAARVLVVCCELSSLHLQPGPEDDLLLGCLLFGDGAAAALVEASEEPRGTGLRLVRDACRVALDSSDQMAWTAGPQGFLLRLSPRVATSLGGVLPEVADELLAGRPRADARWFVHPGGPRILDAAERVLDLPAGAADSGRAALASAGNRSSATVLAMLADSLAEPWRGPAVCLAFGPGLTAEGLLVERA